MFGIVLPIVLIVCGISALIYRQQAGLIFCKLGKAIWTVSTFGLTDMRRFYPEERASRAGLTLGFILTFFGIVFGATSVASFSGPNSFAAMYQADSYLKKTYGDDSGQWSFSCHDVPGSPNDEIVHYKYAGKTGNLKATWDGKEYTFTEEP